jgi:hypothetical protein
MDLAARGSESGSSSVGNVYARSANEPIYEAAGDAGSNDRDYREVITHS